MRLSDAGAFVTGKHPKEKTSGGIKHPEEEKQILINRL